MSAPGAAWFAHRLDSWSKIAREKVKRAADLNNDSPTNTSSDDGSTSTLASMQKENSKDTQKSASSSFEDNCARNSPLSSSPSVLQHQSKSFPPRLLQRTSSISSESSIENLHQTRGSSPQIRYPTTHEPRSHHTASLQEDGKFTYSRSPSPMRDLRCLSLDARSMSPSMIEQGSLKPSSPSQSNLFFSSPGANLFQSTSSPKINRPPLLLQPRNDTCASNPAPPSPLGALQLDLYTRQAGPIVLSARENSVCVGKLHLRINYDSKLSDLAVHLIEAHSLWSADEGGFREVYVRLELKPEIDMRKRETSIFRFETNPYFNQHFKFPISRDQLQLSETELILQVLDADKTCDISGELKVNLEDMDLSKSNEIWGDIIKVKRQAIDRPELLVSLNYLPQAGRLTVNITKAKHLEAEDLFVKVYLIQNGKRMKKKKTEIARKSYNEHIWNEAFTFNLPASNFNSSGLELYVLDNGSNEQDAIGSCGIGLDESIGKDDTLGRDHWKEMMHNPRKPISRWHPIIINN